MRIPASFNIGQSGLGDILTLPPIPGPPPNGPPTYSAPPLLPQSYYHNPIVPDIQLPNPLKRVSPYIPSETKRLFQPNGWDHAIWTEALVWQWIQLHGGLKTCCRIPELGAPLYAAPPFLVMPSNGIVKREIYSQPVSAFQTLGVYNGTDTLIGSWQVPKGYDGSISNVVFYYTGSGLDDGSGEIIWRLMIGQRYAKNLGNVNFTYGGLGNQLLLEGQSIRVTSGQTVSVIANIPASSPVAGGRVFGGIVGWIYPRR